MVAISEAPTVTKQKAGITELAKQLALIGVAILLYFGVRGLTEGNEAAAVRHGLSVLEFERFLGISFESSLQGLILDNSALVTAVNWIYIWGHWPVIAATMIWIAKRFQASEEDKVALKSPCERKRIQSRPFSPAETRTSSPQSRQPCEQRYGAFPCR